MEYLIKCLLNLRHHPKWNRPYNLYDKQTCRRYKVKSTAIYYNNYHGKSIWVFNFVGLKHSLFDQLILVMICPYDIYVIVDLSSSTSKSYILQSVGTFNEKIILDLIKSKGWKIIAIIPNTAYNVKKFF